MVLLNGKGNEGTRENKNKVSSISFMGQWAVLEKYSHQGL